MVRLRRVVFPIFFLAIGAHRRIRIDDFHQGAQQQNDKRANGLLMSSEARGAFIPGGHSNGIFQRGGTQAAALREGSKQPGRHTWHLESHRAAPRLPLGPRRTEVVLQAGGGPEADQERSTATANKQAIKTSVQRPPVVILPGFGNADVDYKTPLGQPEEKGLVAALTRRGFDVSVMKIPRWEWIRVASGVFDLDWWSGVQRPDSLAYGWYLRRARRLIVDASDRNGGARVLVLGHSAGGWLARATLGTGKWELEGDDGMLRTLRASDVVCGLVTLGAPHFPPPAGSAPCATRGALAYCDKVLPGSYLQDEGIAYVTVAGSAIRGNADKPVESADSDATREVQTAADKVYSTRGEGSAARVAYTNYNALMGDGEALGDGVIPIECAHLAQAEQITLDGVLHSINEAGTTLPTERWYGSEKVIDRWMQPTLDKLSG